MTYMEHPVYWDNGDFIRRTEWEKGIGATTSGWRFEAHMVQGYSGFGAGFINHARDNTYGNRHGGGVSKTR